MNDNGFWRQRKKPNPEEDVLITFIYHRDKKPHVCIAQYFPQGYVIDWCPIEDKCDFVKELDDGTWIFTKEMWMESYFHCDDVSGVWIVDDEVTAWKNLPSPCMKGVPKLKDFGETE